MKILLIKLSSLGDTIHTLPSISDIQSHMPHAEITWAIEPAFAEIARLHPHVKRVLPVPLRQAKQARHTARLLYHIYKTIRQTQYDHIIDAQGLLKSSLLSYVARGHNSGYSKACAREPLASYWYQQTYNVPKHTHAIWRTKALCAHVCNYTIPQHLDFAIGTHHRDSLTKDAPVLLFHGTTWESKHYPESHWKQLIKLITEAGYRVAIPWGNDIEHERAKRLATHPQVTVLPRLSLSELKTVIIAARGAIGVDTGLSHLAGAVGTPCVGLYGPTDHTLAGNMGNHQIQVSARRDCPPHPQSPFVGSASKNPQQVPHFLRMENIQPEQAWQALQSLWENGATTPLPHEVVESS